VGIRVTGNRALNIKKKIAKPKTQLNRVTDKLKTTGIN
jgi:hypothetical protein